MIIVSQDKMSIINFNNINEIRVRANQIIMFDNTYTSSDDCSDVLGIYKTEERAKEVLQEIIQKIADTSLVNLMENLQLTIHDSSFALADGISNTYYMPEE